MERAFNNGHSISCYLGNCFKSIVYASPGDFRTYPCIWRDWVYFMGTLSVFSITREEIDREFMQRKWGE